MPRKDFSQYKHFPGTHDNSFDIILRVLDVLAKLPPPIFLLLLFGFSLCLSWGDMRLWSIMFILFCCDWILLSLLNRFGISFGPANPPTLLLAIMRAPFVLLPLWLNVLLQMIGIALVIYGFWIEPHRIKVTYQTLRTPKLNPDQKIRILHLGDLHLERITGRERQLNQLIESLQPDLILFSGDYLNLSYIRDQTAIAQAREVMREWKARLGVYVVSGSPAVDAPDIVPSPLLDGLHLKFLKDEKIELGEERLEIVGLVCSHKPFVDAPKLKSLISNPTPFHYGGKRPQSQFTILLYHSPDLIYEASEAGIDLQLSGHTHGGQVRLPFFGALFAGSLYGKEFEAGRYQVGGSTLYVTRGIGMEGAGAPRVRFLCPPEIILWQIEGV